MVGYFSGDVCSDDRFLCKNHKCVPIEYRCDGDNDCRDGTDEKNCSGKDVFHFPIISYIYHMFK